MSLPVTEPSLPQRMAWSLVITLAGLLGVALLDKLLVIRLGPDAVAQWAQLQAMTELVNGLLGAGLVPGLMVLAAHAPSRAVAWQLLQAATRLGLWTALPLALALAVLIGLQVLSVADLPEASPLPLLTVLSAWLGCAQLLLAGFWMARGEPGRALALSLVLTLGSVGLALFCPASQLLIVQTLWRLLLAGILLVGVWPFGPGRGTPHPLALRRFLWMGLAIGLLSPLSQLLARELLLDRAGWQAMAGMQGLWRLSGWVLVPLAGMLSLGLLPRWAAAHSAPDHARRVCREGLPVILPGLLLLVFCWTWQPALSRWLLDDAFVVSPVVAAGFLAGDGLRLIAWVFLNGLMAARQTGAVLVTELCSLPLFLVLMALCGTRLDLDLAAGCYVMAYAIYAFSTGFWLLRTTARQA